MESDEAFRQEHARVVAENRALRAQLAHCRRELAAARTTSTLSVSDACGLYNTIITHAPVGICVLSGPEHRYVYLNPAYAQFVRGRGEALGMPLAAVLPEIAHQIVPLLDHVCQTGEPCSADDQLFQLDLDGESRDCFFSYRYEPWIDRAGRMQGVIAFIMETTAEVQAHRQSETERLRLQTVLHSLPVGVEITDTSRRIIEMNRWVQRIYAGAAELTMPIQEYRVGKAWWADSGQPVQAGEWPSDVALHEGRPEMGRAAHILRADGTSGTMVNSAVPLRDAEGAITGAVVVIEDITDRRRAEDALRASELKFRTLFENMSEAVAIDELIDDQQGQPMDWIVLDINPAYEEMLGLTREQVIGCCASQLYHEVLDWRQVLEEYSTVVATGRPLVVELAYPRTHRSLLVSVFLMGEHRFATTITDITECKRAEEVRERLLAELDATIAAIPDGYIVYHPDGTIRQMNAIAEQMLGFTKDDLCLDYLRRISTLHVETLDGHPLRPEEIPSYRALQGETVRGMLMRLIRGEHAYWLSVSAAPIRTAEGGMLGVVMEFSDITQLHQLQEQREIYTHSISHDLRAPLAVIQGHAQLLLDVLTEHQTDGLLRQSAEAILRGSQRMSVMIQDLVDAARLEGRQMTLARQPVQLAAYFTDLLNRTRTVLDIARLRLHVPEDLPPVYADYDRLERILVNLIANALQYSASETPVQVTARQRANEVEIAVTDQGVGIAPEDLRHLFERFYRAKGERRTEGIGLGLYITRMLVEAHSGRIWVESVVGRGSTFTFTLPVAPCP